MPIDPLAEIVTLLRPQIRFSKLVECAGPWRSSREGTGDPLFCAVLEGWCCVVVDGLAPVILGAGDFVLVTAMDGLVCGSLDAPADGPMAEPVETGEGLYRLGPGGGPPDARMQIGHCRFGSPDADLLVPLLPRTVLARDEPRFATLVQLVGDESRARRPARGLVLERLLEVLLIEALRSGGGGAVAVPGLVRGLADERLAAALHALHAHPERPWTVAGLAGEAAMSRSAFFVHFSRRIGLKPMEYLLAWRMALARRLLCERGLGVDDVAARVGYSSASTFGVAFARHVGMSPARYGRMGRPSTPPISPDLH